MSEKKEIEKKTKERIGKLLKSNLLILWKEYEKKSVDNQRISEIHNHEVAGSIPAPATKRIDELQRCSSSLLLSVTFSVTFSVTYL